MCLFQEIIQKQLHGTHKKRKKIINCTFFSPQGSPKLIDVTSTCQYVFEWETNVVCSDSSTEKETVNCTFYDERTDYTFDLSPLKEVQKVSLVKSFLHVTKIICQ